MENKETTAKRKKTRQKARKQPQTDFFTVLCRSDLHQECVKEYRFHPQRMWRFDYAMPEHRIALEVEGGVWTGGRHTSPKGFLGDMEKYNTATLMGWRVFRTTPDALLTKATMDMLRQAVQGGFSDKIED
jgi:very-short-patch-repair endonuclease